MAETHWKKLTDPNFLGSWDFQQGEERILTIDRILQEEVYNPNANAKEKCAVAHFKEKSKPIIVNKTNFKRIEALYHTPIVERWAGCKIILHVERTKVKGKMEDCIRVKEELPPKDTQTQKQFNQKRIEAEILLCGDCSNEIEDSGGYTSGQIAKSTLKTYGTQLCMNCGNKRKAEESEESEIDTNA